MFSNYRIIPLILFFISCSVNFAFDPQIKNLRVYGAGDQINFPVIDFSDPDNGAVTIEFDLLSDQMPNMDIIFKFCDADWIPYDNVFLANSMYNKETNLWFDKLPNNIRGARYHYHGSFPNNNVTFPFSGKWKFFIVDSFNRNSVLVSGGFYVIHPQIKLNVTAGRESLRGDPGDMASSGRTLILRTNFIVPDSLFAANVKGVEIINNRKISYPILIDRNSYSADRFFEWDASKKFTFAARNIRPGNEYRITDLRDMSKYNAEPIYAHFGEVELSNLYTAGRRDFNGASYLPDFRNQNSDYLKVTFRLKAPDEIKSSIFLAGSFNEWKVLPEYEMYDDGGMMNLSVELKRGVYEYQFVTGQIINGNVENINWEILEGNFYQTENEYRVFLYYRSEEKGGYDKIIGYRKIKTGAL